MVYFTHTVTTTGTICAMNVTLNQMEHDLAKYVAEIRQDRAVKRGRRDTHRTAGDPLELHFQGACAELAFAKGMNLYPSGLLLPFEEDDDVGGIQVRGRTKGWHDLYLWPQDPLEAAYALVTGVYPTFTLVGWRVGWEVMDETHFAERHSRGRFPMDDCYIIPQSELYPMSELREVING